MILGQGPKVEKFKLSDYTCIDIFKIKKSIAHMNSEWIPGCLVQSSHFQYISTWQIINQGTSFAKTDPDVYLCQSTRIYTIR